MLKYFLLVIALAAACRHEGGDLPSAPASEIAGFNATSAVAGNITVCAGVIVGQDEAHPASAGIQRCVDATSAGGTLALPVGTYYMNSEIIINKPMRLTTAGAGKPCYSRDATGVTITLYGSNNADARCAKFVAASNLQTVGAGFLTGAMLGLGSIGNPVSGIKVDHIILDANRAGRTAANAAFCLKNFCHNIHMYRCDDCALQAIVSAHAMGGYNTIAIDTARLTVTDNLFWDSGYSPYENSPKTAYRPAAVMANPTWSNAFEVQANDRPATGLIVQRNDVIDASDGSLCFAAAGKNQTPIAGDVSSNYIAQINNSNWQAIVLWDTQQQPSQLPTRFGNGGIEDPNVTLTIHDNFIDCNVGGVAKKKCNFGIEIGGQHEVNVNGHLAGVRVRNNVVKNARIGINVDGAGLNVADATKNQWISVTGNRVAASGIAYNKAPESNNAVTNNQYNSVASEKVGADGAQIVGTTGFYGANLAPPGWQALDTSKLCAAPGSTAVVPGVFGYCAGFPAP